MEPYSQIANQIIKSQEVIIGPIAFEQASKISGLKIDLAKHEVSLEGDKKAVLETLVRQYEKLFGRASIEVCREAVKESRSEIKPSDLPDVLR